MRIFLSFALTTFFLLPLVAADAAPKVTLKRLQALAPSLAKKSFTVYGKWERKRPRTCARAYRGLPCRYIRRAWTITVGDRRAKRRPMLDIWIIPQRSKVAARRLVRALESESGEIDTFGKAPTEHWICGRYVLVTVGTFREPASQRRLRRAISSRFGRRCK